MSLPQNVCHTVTVNHHHSFVFNKGGVVACQSLQEPENWQMMFSIQTWGFKAGLGFNKNVYIFSHCKTKHQPLVMGVGGQGQRPLRGFVFRTTRKVVTAK